jgi:carbamoyl-phosphate synthase large subunit
VDDKIRVLMTGAGAPGGAGIIKALSQDQNIKLYVTDMNSSASGRHLSENFHLIPKATDDQFIPFVIDLCSSLDIDLIFPLVTAELFKLSQYKAQFEAINTKVVVSEYGDLLIANNKGKLYQHLKDSGVSTPDFKVVDSRCELEAAVEKMGYPGKPVVMKPCLGNGSRGVRVLDATKDRFDLLFHSKPNSLFTSLEEVLVSIGDNEIPKLVVSEYLPGDELTIDTLVDNGIVKDCLIRTRDLINSGISVSGRFIKEEAVKNYIEKIISLLPGLYGPIGFQVKQDISGSFQILESNPRIQGTSVAALGLGVNLPLNAVNMALEKTISISENTYGIGFFRYYNEVFYEC